MGQLGFLLTLPVLVSLGLERGFVKATAEVVRARPKSAVGWSVTPIDWSGAQVEMILSGGVLFFLFGVKTKAYYFTKTLLSGGAKYMATGCVRLQDRGGRAPLRSLTLRVSRRHQAWLCHPARALPAAVPRLRAEPLPVGRGDSVAAHHGESRRQPSAALR
jgi:hypothetical protein